HYPVFDRGGYFARMETHRSYCIAARLSAEPPRGLLITAGSPAWSYRDAGDLLIVCGSDHVTGDRGVDEGVFTRLERHAREHWDVDEVVHRWSAQDPVPYGTSTTTWSSSNPLTSTAEPCRPGNGPRRST
ncbi:MAG: hypothetical protein V7646_6133, partial [Pseudonocardia sp.]